MPPRCLYCMHLHCTSTTCTNGHAAGVVTFSYPFICTSVMDTWRWEQCVLGSQSSQDTQLTHHSASGDFPQPVPLFRLPVGVVSSSLSGQQQPTGALLLHLCQHKQHSDKEPPHTHSHTLTPWPLSTRFHRRTDEALNSINWQVRKQHPTSLLMNVGRKPKHHLFQH